MSRPNLSLDVIDVASPCQASWGSMRGDDRTRFCSECSLHVYNISGMNRSEAEQLVSNAEGRLCVRFFRRSDGTVLTQDCPVGVSMIRRRAARMLAGVSALLAFLMAGFAAAASSPSRSSLAGTARSPLQRIVEWLDPPMAPIQGKMVMGDICLPAPPQPVAQSESGSVETAK